MPEPDIFFSRQWETFPSKTRCGLFQYLARSNIVHHTSIQTNKGAAARLASVYRCNFGSTLRTVGELARMNLDSTVGENSHYRLRVGADGKLLVFGTGNLILAGMLTHASACTSITRFLRHLTRLQKTPLWPSIHSAPNMVVTGQLKMFISPKVRTDILCNCSDKFPGIALNVSMKGCTPQLFLKRSMVIIPGLTSAHQLKVAVERISAILAPYVTSQPS
jgi:TATA-box binding protein (TBP) (component of TFIID and TFIIIB)